MKIIEDGVIEMKRYPTRYSSSERIVKEQHDRKIERPRLPREGHFRRKKQFRRIIRVRIIVSLTVAAFVTRAFDKIKFLILGGGGEQRAGGSATIE